jgi:hypothetical protein
VPDEIAHLKVLQPQNGVDLSAPNGVRICPGDLLDVHPTLVGHHAEVSPGRSIERDRGVELLRDVDQAFHQHPGHPGSSEPFRQDLLRGLFGLLGGLHEGDAAGLPPSADLHLRLNGDLAPEPVGDATRFLG